MKQIQFSSFGQPSVVARCVDVPDVGSPAAWEVVVDVDAFPINVADLAMMAGRYGVLPKLPATIGMEGVGRVTECGASVKNIAVGDRVVLLANGNWSQRRRVPATTVHKVPSDIDPFQLAMLKVNPATAMMMLTTILPLKEGDWILQTAPMGTVGQCVIQIAKDRRFKTINICRSDEAKVAVRELGGDVVVDLDANLVKRVKEIIGCDPLNLGFDAVAGPGVAQIAECLSDGGTIVNYGMLSSEPCIIAPEQTVFHSITLRGFWLSKILNRLQLEDRTNLFDPLCSLIQNKSLRMSIDSVYPIEAIGDALRRAEQNGRKGKVIVTPNETKEITS